MSHVPERLGPSLRAAGGPPSAPSLANASTAADNPTENVRRGGTRRKGRLSRLLTTGVALELVSDDSDETLDLKAVHDAVAILLVRYYRKTRSESVTGGMA